MAGDQEAQEKLKKLEESAEARVGKTDSRIFWMALYLTPCIWGFLLLMQILSLRLFWVNVAGVCFALSFTNA